jgi:hypothetical protein
MTPFVKYAVHIKQKLIDKAGCEMNINYVGIIQFDPRQSLIGGKIFVTRMNSIWFPYFANLS